MALTLPPVIADADRAFRELAEGMGLAADDQWAGGYVEYEWQHGRHAFETLGTAISGANVLEFGCNVGASAVVLATLGAHVTGLDVDEALLRLARANVARYGLEGAVSLLHVPDTRRLPFDDARFDVVCCNSVLEYVPHDQLPAVKEEIDRVLKHGGLLFVTGTSSRLWPREVHSRRWLVNWLPRAFDRVLRHPGFQRGVWPWEIRFGYRSAFRNLDRIDRGHAWLEARRRRGLGRWAMMRLEALSAVARLLGTSAGLLTPNISVRLQKENDAHGGRAPRGTRTG